MVEKPDWLDVGTGLTIASVVVASVGVSLPDLYSKIAIGLAVGLANAAAVANKHLNKA